VRLAFPQVSLRLVLQGQEKGEQNFAVTTDHVSSPISAGRFAMIACHGWSQPQGKALNPHGELYTAVNVGERHAMRNMIDEMRGAGQVIRGPSGLTARNRQEFANQLDRWLARVKKAAQLKGPGPGATELSVEE
jgi:Uncharacterized BCR, YaiI/YqxD family COG1671